MKTNICLDKRIEVGKRYVAAMEKLRKVQAAKQERKRPWWRLW